MPIKKFTGFKHGIPFPIAVAVFLTAIFLISPIINARYAFAASKNEIGDYQMQLKSRIWKWEERIEKSPDNLYSRSEIIKLREEYIGLLDQRIIELEIYIKGNPDDTGAIDDNINLLEEKKKFFINLKEDYIKLADINGEQLNDLHRILMRNPKELMNSYVELYNADEIERELSQLIRFLSQGESKRTPNEEVLDDYGNMSKPDLNRLTGSILKIVIAEIKKNAEFKKAKIKKLDHRIQTVETTLLGIKKNYIGILIKKIEDTDVKDDKTTLREKSFRLLDDCIQLFSEKLKKSPGDKTLVENLQWLKDQRLRIMKK